MAEVPERPVTVHSSWRGVVGGFIGSGVIALAGTAGVIAAGWRTVPTVVFVVGWGLVVVMAFDFPIASTFTADAVERRMALRRQRLVWRDGDLISRTAPRINLVDRRVEHGGLTLVRGRRRYLLVDRPESAAEYDAVVAIVESGDGPGAQLGLSRLPRPAETLAPSWLYRRRRWRPDSDGKR